MTYSINTDFVLICTARIAPIIISRHWISIRSWSSNSLGQWETIHSLISKWAHETTRTLSSSQLSDIYLPTENAYPVFFSGLFKQFCFLDPYPLYIKRVLNNLYLNFIDQLLLLLKFLVAFKDSPPLLFFFRAIPSYSRRSISLAQIGRRVAYYLQS